MKRVEKTFLNAGLKSVKAGDVWLTVFFAIQIVYMTLCVFLPLPDGHEKSVLDVVTRTSAAVLVGYFLSKNFATDRTKALSGKDERSFHKTLQTNVAGIVGLFSLTMLTIIRYVDSTALPYNVVTQLRDFYLASVAFLMGTGD